MKQKLYNKKIKIDVSISLYRELERKFRKSSFETVSYASETAKALGTDVIAVSLESVIR